MLKWKRNNTSQQRREAIRKNHQWKSEKTSHDNKSTSWRQTWMLYCGPPNSSKTNHIRDKSQRTNSVHNIPLCAKSIRQSMARCNNLCPTPEWSKREKLKNDQKRQLQPHSQDTNQAWANKENTNQGQYQTGRSTVSNRIRNTDWWNRNSDKETWDMWHKQTSP